MKLCKDCLHWKLPTSHEPCNTCHIKTVELPNWTSRKTVDFALEIVKHVQSLPSVVSIKL